MATMLLKGTHSADFTHEAEFTQHREYYSACVNSCMSSVAVEGGSFPKSEKNDSDES